MTTQGIIVIDAVGLALLALIINLVRTQRLHVAYSLLWFAATAGVMILVSIPPLSALVTRAVGALFPVSALSLLAFVFIFVVLIFFSVQLSALAARQVELTQELALRDALGPTKGKGGGRVEPGTAGGSGPSAAPTTS